MRKVNTLFILLSVFCCQAQQIDTSTVTAASLLAGLQLTAAEKDSMVTGLRDNARVFDQMHKFQFAE